MPKKIKKVKFDFSECKKISQLQIEDSWLQWFIGFYEGDGTLLYRNDKGFYFAIDQDEIYILEEIKNTLGFGKIRKVTQNKWRYYVERREDIYKLCLILNGNLVLNHRYFKLKEIINIFNEKPFKGLPYQYTITFKDQQILPT